MMPRILVLYHSVFGHIEVMAQAVAEGAREVAGAVVTVKRVPETLPDEALRQMGAKLDQAPAVATPDDLAEHDAILFGTPTRFGNMSGQMRTFFDQTGPLWARGALIGKIGSVFTSSGTQHGGQESTILTAHVTLLHLGMVLVGLPYSEQRQTGVDEIKGGSPYGASTIAGSRGERWPSEQERAMARSQGRHVASLAARLVAGG
jgi:NAD(P)H dehydrogenase (quinone)